VILSLHNSPADTNVTLTISGSNGLSESQKEILLASGAGTLTHTFKMGFDNQWKSGEYKLHVEGVGGTPITYDSTINFVNKHYVILIQSDSPIYRPGDTVIFRVIVLDDYLRPVIDKHIDDMRIYVRVCAEEKKFENIIVYIFCVNNFRTQWEENCLNFFW